MNQKQPPDPDELRRLIDELKLATREANGSKRDMVQAGKELRETTEEVRGMLEVAAHNIVGVLLTGRYDAFIEESRQRVAENIDAARGEVGRSTQDLFQEFRDTIQAAVELRQDVSSMRQRINWAIAGVRQLTQLMDLLSVRYGDGPQLGTLHELLDRLPPEGG